MLVSVGLQHYQDTLTRTAAQEANEQLLGNRRLVVKSQVLPEDPILVLVWF